MADITPTDIVNKEFHRTLNGYARTEVDDFLQQASDALFRALEEQQRLRAQIEHLQEQLTQYAQKETLINNALLLAERTADGVRHAAHQEADLLRREAQERLRAEQVELEQLRQARYRIIAELRAQLQSHLAMLDAQEHHSPAAAMSAEERG